MYRQRRFDDIKHTLRQVEAVLEIALFVLIYFNVWKSQYAQAEFYTYQGTGKYLLMAVYGFLVLILFLYCDSFQFGYLKMIDVLISQWISIFLVNVVTYLQLCLMANHMIGPAPMAVLTGIDFVVALVCTYVFTAIYHNLYVPQNMVMIFGNDEAVTLKFKMDTRTDKYQIRKLISIHEGYEKICKEIVKYDAVVINDVPGQIRNDILKFCYRNGIRTYMAPKLTDIICRGAADITLFDTPLLLVKGRGLTLVQRAMKRTMDVVCCLIAMIPATPLMLIVAVAIKLEDGGPVFYKQKRVTKDGKTFDILKFRSMIVDAEKEGKSIPATGKDPRITRVGHITRATRLDELPQILNILKGDMSIVGPRPERVEHVEKYKAEIPEFEFRTKVKGGLTGYAQIYGKYNTSAYDKLRLDLMYIENYSILLDIKLILMTLRIMVKPESTEGFEKIEELERMKATALQEIAVTKEHTGSDGD